MTTAAARSDPPAHGLPDGEFEARLMRAQELISADDLDALVVTSPHNVRYFTGFNTQFWESPTRPWFIIVPRTAGPIAVIPEIGVPGMSRTFARDIRSWPAPQPDDDGVSLLAATLGELPALHGRIGWELGRESVLRMPVADFQRLAGEVPGFEFVNGTPVIWRFRMVKSEAEIARIAHACRIASDAFGALPGQLTIGDTEYDVSRKIRMELHARGADTVPFAAVLSGKGGYDQIIVGPSERPLERGDILFIDLGATYDGYSCDFDRNYAIGEPDDAVKRAHELVWQATEAGMAAARPGATATDLWRAMTDVLDQAGSGDLNVGRLGHGLGMQLTEPPSNMPGDETVLQPGMVMTIEPGLEFAPGKMLVHEENIVIRDGACELLTTRAPREVWTVDG